MGSLLAPRLAAVEALEQESRRPEIPLKLGPFADVPSMLPHVWTTSNCKTPDFFGRACLESSRPREFRTLNMAQFRCQGQL